MAQVPPPPPPPAPPPPPSPPPPPPPLAAPGRVLRDALERAGTELGGDGGLQELLRRRRECFSGPLKWLLFHRPAPPLIQDGPQCGLAALGMAAALLKPPPAVGVGALLEAARARGFSARGEMFSAVALAALAREVLGCGAEVLAGGLGGGNRPRVLRHLVGGRPLLVPYDEDRNHAPCQRRGHKAHWALLTGVLVGIDAPALPPPYCADPEVPNVFRPPPRQGEGAAGGGWEGFLEGGGHFWRGGGAVEGLWVLAQQGKSPRGHLWGWGALHASNAQLRELSPRRGGPGGGAGGQGWDGHLYVVPAGGLEEGLMGRVVLLYPPGWREPPQ